MRSKGGDLGLGTGDRGKHSEIGLVAAIIFGSVLIFAVTCGFCGWYVHYRTIAGGEFVGAHAQQGCDAHHATAGTRYAGSGTGNNGKEKY